MSKENVGVVILNPRAASENAVKELWRSGFDFKKLSIKGVTQMKKIFTGCFMALFLVGFMAGCGDDNTGTISVSLSDSSSDLYNAVYVTIDAVQVHQDGTADDQWITVASPQITLNLLDLVNGVRENLGIASLSAGHYTQMRLIIGTTPDDGINILSQAHPFANYVIDASNQYHELKIPSGEQTGIKIVHGFDINAGGTTELMLDFDALKSVVIAGASGQYLLKPTIKVLNTADYSILNGTVTDETGTEIPGAMVMAQTFDSMAVDKKDAVTVQTSTVTDDGTTAGAYALFLEPGTYNIIVYKAGFSPQFGQVTLTAGQTLSRNFMLTAASTGRITGQVTITDANAETFVTISLREAVAGPEIIDEMVEIASVNVANGGDYAVTLPAGTYEVVRSTSGGTTQDNMVTVDAGMDTLFNIVFE